MTDNPQPPVLVVAGPTASGKSALALDLAVAFGGTVINADSMQVYRELRVLTARPSPADEARVPHRLYGVVSVAEGCSAARWREMALAEIAAARSAGRLPILCGGTGLYLRALMDGLSPVPAVPAAVRDGLRARLRSEGVAALHRQLMADDPAMAARLNPADGQRVLRALEVLQATGRSLADWQAAAGTTGPECQVVLLDPPRPELHAAIAVRAERMLAEGALDEVGLLAGLGLSPDLPAMKAVGVPALLSHLRGDLTLDAAEERLAIATRQLAKRQATWFRHQIIANFTSLEKYSERILDKIFLFVREKVLTP